MSNVHLHVHTHGSFLDSTLKPKELAVRAAELKMPAVAITDHGNIFNAIEFYSACKKANIKPILGCEFNIVDSVPESINTRSKHVQHIILLSETNTGWQNIIKLVSLSNSESNFYYCPRIDLEMLRTHKEGIIALSACTGGVVASYLTERRDENGDIVSYKNLFRADAAIRQFLSIFGPNHFFLEVQDINTDLQRDVNNELRKLALKHGLKTVWTSNVHYLNRSDKAAHETLIKIGAFGTQMSLSDAHTDDQFLKSREEIGSDILPHEIDLTIEIANRCNVDIDLTINRLPSYPYIPDNKTAIGYLTELVQSVLVSRKLDKNSIYVERVKKELSDISTLGFADYFLIVSDVINWARSQNMLIGPGRGSAGGSLVSYLLGITNIDPIEYGLIWERFLNVGRKSPPDIDSDIPRSKRGLVIDYIRSRFGEDNVAQLATFNKLAARAVLKDVFKVFGMEFDEANEITKLVPAKDEDHVAITLDKAIDSTPALQVYEERYKPWFTIARGLEGCYKSLGTHAAAVVISDKPFSNGEYPLCRSADSKSRIFAWDMDAVDKLHLLKLDVLGLSTLDVIQDTFDLVKKRHHIQLSLENMPLNDSKTFNLLADGKTIGVFQLEGQLGKTWSKLLHPSTISEMSDLVSLIRPGPLETGMVESYQSVGDGQSLPSYPHAKLKPILDSTRGSLIYQEQIIEICKQMAGMSLVDADHVRKCIPAGSKILTYKHGYVPIEKLMSYKDRRVQSIDLLNFRSKFDEVIDVWPVGRKLVYEIKTRSGHTIRATADHEFLIEEKWTRLSDINIGDHIAVAHKTETQGNSKITDADITLSALLISEGYIPESKGGYFCNTDPFLLEQYRNAFFSKFNENVPNEYSSNGVTYCSLHARHRTELEKLFKFGLSAEKEIGDNIVNASLEKLRKFVGLYVSCDGHTDDAGIHVTSASKQICLALKRILLRMGIFSSVYSKYNAKYDRHYWNVCVSSKPECNRLMDAISEYLTPSKRREWNLDNTIAGYVGVPNSIVINELERRMNNTGRSKRDLWTDSGSVLNTVTFSKYNVGDLFVSEKLSDIQSGDMIWDMVESISFIGEEDVYDFTMSNTNRPHAFINDILTHNCMGKKKPEEMKKWQQIFVDGCTKNHIPEEKSQEIWSWIERFAGYGFNRCLSGKTIVTRAGANDIASREITIEELWEYFHGKNYKTSTGKKYRNKSHPKLGLRIMSLKENRAKPGRVLDVIKNGTKETWQVTLANGMNIRGTKDHRIMSANGWTTIGQLQVGTPIIVSDLTYEETSNKYFAKISRFSKGDRAFKKNVQYYGVGANNTGYIDGGNVAFKAIKNQKHDTIGACEKCGDDESRLEMAHLDGDHANQDYDNLKLFCVSCHKKHDYQYNNRNARFSKGYPTYTSEVISIDNPQHEETYDIEMAEPEHNFFGNGICTHNSHGVGYALLAYYTAYLKANYTIEFFCACLRNAAYTQDPLSEIKKFIHDARLFDINVTPPNISHGNIDFDIVNNNEIAFGLSALKGVGEKAIPLVLEANQNITSFDAFLFKTRDAKINKRVMEALILSGALDHFQESRNQMMAKYCLVNELTDNEWKIITDNANNWLTILRDLSDDIKSQEYKTRYKIPNIKRRSTLREAINAFDGSSAFDDPIAKINWEQELLGIALTGSLTALFRTNNVCSDVINYGGEDMPVDLAVQVSVIKPHKTKKGPMMAFMTAGDETYELDNFVIFPAQYRKYQAILSQGAILRVRGKMSHKGSVIVETLERVR